MALYFYFNETTGDMVYSDQTTYGTEGYTSLGEQTNMSPGKSGDWVFDSKRSSIKTISKDPAVDGKISGLTSVFSMFYGCHGLTSLDLSGFDTSLVTNMGSMFSGCSGLTCLDLSGFDTSKATRMTDMFNNCTGLTFLDLSGFDTSKVTYMGSMFSGCTGLASLDLSGFDTSKVISMTSMFSGCSSLASLDLSGFDTSKVTVMSVMFNRCSSLRLLAISASMSNVLSQLPAAQYYPASGGDPVAKASLTAGTWVRHEADLALVATLVETAQAAMALRRKLTSLAKRVAALESKAV